MLGAFDKTPTWSFHTHNESYAYPPHLQLPEQACQQKEVYRFYTYWKVAYRCNKRLNNTLWQLCLRNGKIKTYMCNNCSLCWKLVKCPQRVNYYFTYLFVYSPVVFGWVINAYILHKLVYICFINSIFLAFVAKRSTSGCYNQGFHTICVPLAVLTWRIKIKMYSKFVKFEFYVFK